MFPESHDRLGRSRKHETDVDITLTQDHNIAGRSLSFVWSLRSVGDLFPDAHAKVMPLLYSRHGRLGLDRWPALCPGGGVDTRKLQTWSCVRHSSKQAQELLGLKGQSR